MESIGVDVGGGMVLAIQDVARLAGGRLAASGWLRIHTGSRASVAEERSRNRDLVGGGERRTYRDPCVNLVNCCRARALSGSIASIFSRTLISCAVL
jgi:hypothetical protein